MSDRFFLWAEPLLIDDDNLRDYFHSGQTPPDQHFDFVLAFYWQLYELELEAGLLSGAEVDWEA